MASGLRRFVGCCTVALAAFVPLPSVAQVNPEASVSQAAEGFSTDVIAPPAPGPDLLKYSPEQIEEAYEGKEMPEAVAMYLIIARGGQLDGRGGWFRSAESRYSWAWLAERNGIKPEDSLPKDQFKGDETIFDQLDRDRNGILKSSDLDWSDDNPWVQQAYMIGRIFRRIESSGEGKLTAQEWQDFFTRLAGQQDSIRIEQLRNALIPPSSGFSPGDMPSKEVLIHGLMTGEIGSLQEGPDVDEIAPDFELRPLGGGEPIRLSDRIGQKPIVLVFGNFTCGPFRSMYPSVEAVHERQKENADFLMVYVREAHPTNGWAMKSNEKVGVSVTQPTTLDERRAVAEQCAAKLKPSMPLLVDDVNDAVGNAYSGMPARLYVIDRNGRVAYKSGRGPFGFKPEEMEQALLMSMLQEASEKPAVAVPDDAEAWKLLPTAISGSEQPLPVWARAVATHLPRTAAAMLELDFAHRTKSPVDPILRAKMRWVIADANHCEYSKAYALSDLKRAGGADSDVAVLEGDPSAWPEADQEPLEFARLLTVAAPTIPDQLFADLRKTHGDNKVASMVLLAAYGNFQDRIILGLQLPMEASGPLAPLNVEFVEGALQRVSLLPPKGVVPELNETGEDIVSDDADWGSVSFDELQSRLEAQRNRQPRLPIPTWDEVKGKLPPAMATRPTRIVWSLMTYGYAADLQIPWSIATRTMWAERPGDRVFEESLFWIQTRAIECNYCMGHCEMLLEVAGLDKKAVTERTRRLASDDWSAFSPEEQRAYAYARKLSKTPWTLTSDEYQTLEKDLGSAQAMSTFWWLCRGLYMTRISDGFQLPLERENVFGDMPKK
ncbi:MAG: deiodinase family protein [Planctomycetales bacterium]|nr:deiodinase family protein [Planctomycetales bacterium]